MKTVVNICLVLAVLSNNTGTFAKKYENRQLEKDRSGLFPPKKKVTAGVLADQHQKQETNHEELNRAASLKGTPTARHLEDVEVEEDDDILSSEDVEVGDDDSFLSSSSQWYTAESLDYFRNGIPPEFFEWVNPEEIVAGGTTCGFLYPALGSVSDTIFPFISVYVCVRFANVQPASKGNLFVHCGGPSSLSNCGMVNGRVVGEQSLNDYNILTIDQRGMGRSYPSFAHEECSLDSFVRDGDGTIIARIPPEETINGTNYADFDSVVASLQPRKARVLSCWTCTSCGFQMSATQLDGTERAFNFLEYSGTRQLAEDIERMRILLNAPYMHVFGISYGTSVFGTYATIFPSSVGLFVLDSTISPDPNMLAYARVRGIGEGERIDYLIYSCSARNIQNPGSCPVADMRQCIGDANQLIESEGVPPGEEGQYITLFLASLYLDPGRAELLCTYAASGEADALIESVLEIVFGDSETRSQRFHEEGPSKPTSPDAVYGNPEYPIFMSNGDITTSFVRAQDNAGASYDEDFFAREVVEFNAKYRGAGTGVPGAIFAISWGHSFYWPKSVPLPPMGSPYLTGIVAGSLYDSNTPYRWTQQMRAAFPNTNLLTSQSIRHGLVSIAESEQAYSCNQRIIDYLSNGFVGFVDGTVCGAEYASETDFLGQFGLGSLLGN